MHINMASLISGEIYLQYIEEPVEDVNDLAAFFHSTQIPVAMDETLDDAIRQAGKLGALPPAVIEVIQAGGLAGLVVKPAVVGGFEQAWEIARWARLRNIEVNVCSHDIFILCTGMFLCQKLL